MHVKIWIVMEFPPTNKTLDSDVSGSLESVLVFEYFGWVHVVFKLVLT